MQAAILVLFFDDNCFFEWLNVCFTEITFRQRRVRLDKLVNLCQKLNLPCPNLVAETALLMLDKDLADSRKNITQKLMGAAIYTSCKFHSIQITSKVNVSVLLPSDISVVF